MPAILSPCSAGVLLLHKNRNFRSLDLDLHLSSPICIPAPPLSFRLCPRRFAPCFHHRRHRPKDYLLMDDNDKANSHKKLHTRMRLWEFSDKYIVEPTDGIVDSYLSISRSDGSLALVGELPQCGSMQSPKVQTIFGVIGMLRLLVGSYLLVISERECVGSYLGHAIYKASALEILPCNHTLNNSSAEQRKLEAEFSVLLNAAERTSGLYFSYDVNLTLSAQRLHDLGNESKLLPLWQQADPRFLWNNYLLEAFIDSKLDSYLLPVIQGNILKFLMLSIGS